MKTQHLIYSSIIFCLCYFSFMSCNNDDGNLPPNSFRDARDGNVYQTVTIGDQIWMAENLKYLPFVVGPDIGSNISPYYYVNDFFGTDVNDAKRTENYDIYGVLYNWPAAMNGALSSNENPSGIQGVCPDGWHLPSNAEWQELLNFIGGEAAADLLIKTDTNRWEFPNDNATNEFGFSALPGGSVAGGSDVFLIPGFFGYWWASQEEEGAEENARLFRLSHENVVVIGFSTLKSAGFSVRCVKD